MHFDTSMPSLNCPQWAAYTPFLPPLTHLEQAGEARGGGARDWNVIRELRVGMMQTNMETVPYLTKTFMVGMLYLLQSTAIHEMLDNTTAILSHSHEPLPNHGNRSAAQGSL